MSKKTAENTRKGVTCGSWRNLKQLEKTLNKVYYDLKVTSYYFFCVQSRTEKE